MKLRSFIEVRDAIEASDRDEADRIVRALVDRAAATRSREHEALGYFAQGVFHAGGREYREAEKALRIALDIARTLHPAKNHPLGMVARSLGVVLGHLDQPEQAVDLFLLARNVFEATDPELAPEVVRLSAACFVAVKRYDEALAVVHQSIGPADAPRTLTTPEELELCLLRARILDEQLKPAQALKARALVTQMVQPSLAMRRQVVAAWIQIAGTWRRAGNCSGASLAVHCAAQVANEHRGPLASAVELARGALFVNDSGWGKSLVPRAQHRSIAGVLAVGSPVIGLRFDRVAQFVEVGDFVDVERDAHGNFVVRAAHKMIEAHLVGDAKRLEGHPPPAAGLFGKRCAGPPFEPGDEVRLHDGSGLASTHQVLAVNRRGLILASWPERRSHPMFDALRPHGVSKFVGIVPAGAASSNRLTGVLLDAGLRELLS